MRDSNQIVKNFPKSLSDGDLNAWVIDETGMGGNISWNKVVEMILIVRKICRGEVIMYGPKGS